MADIPKPKSNFDATKDTKSCPLCHVRTHAFWAAGLHRFIQMIDCTQPTREALQMMADGGLRALPEVLARSLDNAANCPDCAAAERQRGEHHHHVRVRVMPANMYREDKKMIGEIGITLGIPKTIYVITWSWMGETKVVASTNRREAELYFNQMAQSGTLRAKWREYDMREEEGE